MKVWIISGGHWYEGADPIHVASSAEKAEQWQKDNYEFRSLYPLGTGIQEDKYWAKKENWKWCKKELLVGNFYFDFINIDEYEVDQS